MKELIFGKTYALTDELAEELDRIDPVLRAAYEYQKQFPDYCIPYSYWTDKDERLYIRWDMADGTEDRPVWRYFFDKNNAFCAEKIKRNLSKKELLRGNNLDAPVITITGDTHRKFERLLSFTQRFGVVDGDLMIILGDACINYYGNGKDDLIKYRLSKLGIKLFCIHGNHEMRPGSTGLYSEKVWNGGKVYVEDKYPFLMFAKDGEIYDIGGYKTLVIGGAYSVDKYYRQSQGYQWFSDEQPSGETRAFVERQLEKHDWSVDVVLSHTVPYKYRPVDHFIQGLDQSTVDSGTERWLGEIEERLTYKRWYAGHFHCDRDIDELKIMYRKVCLFMNDTDLGFEMV